MTHDSLTRKINNILIENYSYHWGVFWGIWRTIQRTGIHAGWGETVGTQISLIFTRFESCRTNSFISDRCGAPRIRFFYEIDWLTWLRFWDLSRAEIIITVVRPFSKNWANSQNENYTQYRFIRNDGKTSMVRFYVLVS